MLQLLAAMKSQLSISMPEVGEDDQLSSLYR